MPIYGLSIDLPFTGDPDPTLPYAGDFDAIETPGSIFLLEPNHSANPLVGVPAVGGAVPNILSAQLSAARVAAGKSAGASLGFTRNGVADLANILKTERTGKGGLHGIISQTNMTSNNQSFGIRGGADMADWFNSFPAHAYYFSVWDMATRVALAGGPSEHVILTGVNTSNFVMLGSPTTFTPTNLGSLLTPTPIDTVNVPRFRSVGVSAPVGTATNNIVDPFQVGCFGPYQNSGLTGFGNKSASRVLYRSYCEDLTVSGRTYAQVQAIDYALWQAATGAGGRYNADTFTAPFA